MSKCGQGTGVFWWAFYVLDTLCNFYKINNLLIHERYDYLSKLNYIFIY